VERLYGKGKGTVTDPEPVGKPGRVALLTGKGVVFVGKAVRVIEVKVLVLTGSEATAEEAAAGLVEMAKVVWIGYGVDA
jgi:hypothetical protein